MISEALERNINKQWIIIKPNFIKFFDKINLNISKRFISDEEKQKILKEVSRKIFVILNRANSDRKTKNTSPVTALYWKTFLWVFHLETISVLKKIAQSDIFQSISCMQNGLWIIKEEDFDELIELFTINWVLDKELLKPFSSMQQWKWILLKEDFKLLIELCTENWELNRELLSSITWMQSWKWMILEKDFNKLKELCTKYWKNNEFDIDLLRSITWMQYKRWMIIEEDFELLIELCSYNWELDRSLLKSITSMQTWRWMIKRVDFELLINLCTINNKLDRLLLKSITSIQKWKWMIKKEDFYKLIELCTINNKLNKKRLKFLTWKRVWKWMIYEKCKDIIDNINWLFTDNIKNWKLELELHENELRECWIIRTKDNKWYLKNAKSIRRWPKIWWKNLMCYPNLAFNKFNWIWNAEWMIISKVDLEKLFRLLWMDIVNSMEEKEIIKNQLKKYREIIELEKEKLISIWVVIDDEWIWYLSEVKSVNIWPKIWWKYLPVFPSSTFNKFNKIWNKQWLIRNSKDLWKLLKFLWIKIATFKQEKIRWKKQIESHEEELFKIWIIRWKWNNWFFEKIKPANNWPKIWKNNLRTFPSVKVNKINKIWTNDGVIQSRFDLIYLFNFLWMNLIKIKKNT